MFVVIVPFGVAVALGFFLLVILAVYFVVCFVYLCLKGIVLFLLGLMTGHKKRDAAHHGG